MTCWPGAGHLASSLLGKAALSTAAGTGVHLSFLAFGLMGGHCRSRAVGGIPQELSS